MTMREENQSSYLKKRIQLQGVSDRYDRVVRVLGDRDVVDAMQYSRIYRSEKASRRKTARWSKCPREVFTKDWLGVPEKSEMENQQRKKNKTKNRGMER